MNSSIAGLFCFLFLVSFFCLIIGVVKPDIFVKIFKEVPSRNRILKSFGLLSLAFFFLVGITAEPVQDNQQNSSLNVEEEDAQEADTTSQASLESESQQIQEADTGIQSEGQKPVSSGAVLPQYQIVNELTIRYDGGKSYYVLTSPVNLENADFKNDIKAIVKKIVSEKGNKISIDILDDKDVMDLYFRSHYASNQLGRVLNGDELDQIGDHFIANYSGDLETGLYRNDLYFFPGTFEDNPKVGKYIEDIEFNAAA